MILTSHLIPLKSHTTQTNILEKNLLFLSTRKRAVRGQTGLGCETGSNISTKQLHSMTFTSWMKRCQSITPSPLPASIFGLPVCVEVLNQKSLWAESRCFARTPLLKFRPAWRTAQLERTGNMVETSCVMMGNFPPWSEKSGAHSLAPTSVEEVLALEFMRKFQKHNGRCSLVAHAKAQQEVLSHRPCHWSPLFGFWNRKTRNNCSVQLTAHVWIPIGCKFE